MNESKGLLQRSLKSVRHDGRQGNLSTKSALRLAASEAVSSLVKSSEAETLEFKKSSMSSSISSSSKLAVEVNGGTVMDGFPGPGFLVWSGILIGSGSLNNS